MQQREHDVTAGLAAWLPSPDDAQAPLLGVDRSVRPPVRQYAFRDIKDCDPFTVLVSRLCTHFDGVPDAASLTDIHSDKIESEEYERAEKLAAVLRGFVDMDNSDPAWAEIVRRA